jgi:hypothetical protein
MPRGSFLMIFIFASATVVGQSASTQGASAKELFYDPTSGATLKPDHQASQRTGLMYYVELINSNGEAQRVNVDRIFHSGEKIRLHFQSNVRGRLKIVQSQQGRTPETLFPDPKVNDGRNEIEAHADTIIPSNKAWFKFDENPGEVKLQVLLCPENASAGKQAANEDVACSNTEASVEVKQAGTKGLLVEVDNSSDSRATYVVTRAKPRIALEFVLTHRP